MVNAFVYGVVAALGAQLAVAAPTAENKPPGYNNAPPPPPPPPAYAYHTTAKPAYHAPTTTCTKAVKPKPTTTSATKAPAPVPTPPKEPAPVPTPPKEPAPMPMPPKEPAPMPNPPKTPAPMPTCKNRTSELATFDDLTGLPGLIFNDIPTPYKGLEYAGIGFTSVIATGTNLQPGIRPHSGFSYAAINVVTQLQGTPTLTTNYPNSTIDSFDLSTFYFACVVQLGQGAAALPQACNVEISGYRGSDNSVSNARRVCSQQFHYTPASLLTTVDPDFSGPVDPRCTDLDFAVVTFSLEGAAAAALQPLAALVIDDLKYSTCSL